MNHFIRGRSPHFAVGISLIAAVLVPVISSAETFKPITVTADRMPSANVLAANSVITRADIDRLQINDLPSLLSRFPGIDLSMSGGLGKNSSIFIRGTNSSHVLFLVDGVKWRSATSGTAAIQDFPVDQIERIEIVRGPRSGLYGSEAIGGVIQIFTRKGQVGQHPHAEVAIGTHNSKRVSAGISGGDDATRYSINFSHLGTDGINAKEASNPDRDGYRNNSVSARLDHQFSDDWSAGINLLQVDGYNQYDGYQIADKFFTNVGQQVLGAHTAYQINKIWSLKANLAESKDEADNYHNGNPDNDYLTRHYHGNLTNTLVLNPNHSLNVGFDYDEDKVDSNVHYDVDSRNNKALFVSWQAKVNQQSWLASVRHDDNEAYGNHTTGNIDWGYQLAPRLQFTAGFGSAFKAPTINDMYYPDIGSYKGNPDLKPEKSRSFNLGLNAQNDWGDWDLQLYRTEIHDLIIYQNSTMENVNQALIRGVELSLNTEILGWDLNMNTSMLLPENEKTGKQLSRRTKQLANINLDKQFGSWSTGLSWKLSGYRYDDAANTNRLGGYGLLDLRLAYQLDQDWALKLSAQNLLDKEYQTVKDYNSLDRIVMFTVSYNH